MGYCNFLNVLIICFYYIFQCDFCHPLFCAFWDFGIVVTKRQLDIDADTALRVGMGIQVERGLVPLHRPVDVQQRDGGKALFFLFWWGPAVHLTCLGGVRPPRAKVFA